MRPVLGLGIPEFCAQLDIVGESEEAVDEVVHEEVDLGGRPVGIISQIGLGIELLGMVVGREFVEIEVVHRGHMTVRYFGLYANAHRGKVKKASLGPFPLRIVEDKLRRIPSKGWAEMIRKVYEVDPLLCPHCGGTMKVIAFLSDFSVVDRIINHLKLTFMFGLNVTR